MLPFAVANRDALLLEMQAVAAVRRGVLTTSRPLTGPDRLIGRDCSMTAAARARLYDQSRDAKRRAAAEEPGRFRRAGVPGAVGDDRGSTPPSGAWGAAPLPEGAGGRAAVPQVRSRPVVEAHHLEGSLRLGLRHPRRLEGLTRHVLALVDHVVRQRSEALQDLSNECRVHVAFAQRGRHVV